MVTRSYGYDAAGNLTCLDPSGTTPCSLSHPYVENFTYSAQNRLLGMAGPWLTDPDTYAYDAAGDLTTKTEAQTTVSLSGYLTGGLPANAPASVNGTSYQYDKAGNLTSRGSTSYQYDWQNHLIQVTQNGQVTQFAYDGDGNLVQRTDPSENVTVYVDERAEVNPTTNTWTDRVAFGDRLVFVSPQGQPPSYLYPDYLQSMVSAKTDNYIGGVLYGATTDTVEYTPYGLYRNGAGTLPTDRQFQGQQNQASVGLYHMGARWYDPSIGLWTQPDTIVPNPMDPLSLNRYAFVEGNPLRYRDPLGHSEQTDCQGTTGCATSNTQSPQTSDSTANAASPPSGQSPCDLMPLACKSVGNYAVWVYICLDGDCDWVYVPIPGAVAPPDASTDLSGPSEDTGTGAAASGFAKAITGPDTTGGQSGDAFPPIKKGSVVEGRTVGKHFSYLTRLKAFWENPKRVCVYCHMEGATVVDHAVPRSRGGSGNLDNAQLVCEHCNASKGARDYPVNPPPDYVGPWPPPWWDSGD